MGSALVECMDFRSECRDVQSRDQGNMYCYCCRIIHHATVMTGEARLHGLKVLPARIGQDHDDTLPGPKDGGRVGDGPHLPHTRMSEEVQEKLPLRRVGAPV